jgi:lactate/malate dehydrogenase, NAD binding domain
VTGCRLPKLCLLPCSQILVRASFEKVSSSPRHALRFAEELGRRPEVLQKKQWAGPLPCHPRTRRRPVTIITAGLSQSGSRAHIKGMQKTATILKGLVTDVSRHNPLGILLIASNPVDVLTYAAWKWSGRQPRS